VDSFRSESSDLARAKESFARALAQTGKPNEAMVQYREARDYYSRLKYKRDVIRNLVAEGNLLHELGRTREAIEVFKTAEAKAEVVLVDRPLDLVNVKMNLAFACLEGRRIEEASALVENCVSLCKENHAINPPTSEFTFALRGLAQVKQAQGESKESEDMFSAAFSCAQFVFGEIHEQTIACLMALGSLHQKNANHEKAMEVFNEALRRARKAGAEREEAIILANMGNSMIENQGLGDSGRILLEKSLEKMRRIHGSGSIWPSMLTLANIVAVIDSRDHDEISNAAQALEKMAMDLGNSKFHALALWRKGAINFNCRQFDDAAALWEEAIEVSGDEIDEDLKEMHKRSIAALEEVGRLKESRHLQDKLR